MDAGAVQRPWSPRARTSKTGFAASRRRPRWAHGPRHPAVGVFRRRSSSRDGALRAWPERLRRRWS